MPLLLWIWLRRTPYVESLLAVGDHDATAFSAGVNVNAVRISAYAIGGLIAAVGGIALTGLVRSADAQVFNNYILVALAAVALGGTNLAGGRGGLFPSMMGATCIFLLENLLTSLHASAYFIEVAYGGVLLRGRALRRAHLQPDGARMTQSSLQRLLRTAPLLQVAAVIALVHRGGGEHRRLPHADEHLLDAGAGLVPGHRRGRPDDRDPHRRDRPLGAGHHQRGQPGQHAAHRQGLVVRARLRLRARRPRRSWA